MYNVPNGQNYITDRAGKTTVVKPNFSGLKTHAAGAGRVTCVPERNPIRDVTERDIVESFSIDSSPESRTDGGGGCALTPDGSKKIDLGMLFILLMVIPFAVKSRGRTTKVR